MYIFVANMNSVRKIRLFTILGLIAILSLQIVWLFNTYMLVKNNLIKESFEALEESLDREVELRIERTPKETQIIGGSTNDSVPHLTYFSESLSKLGLEVSLDDIDSIASSILLRKYDIESTYMICMINIDTREVLQKSKSLDLSFQNIVKSMPFPIRTDLSQGVQLILLNPYWTIFTCIIYQIKIIIRQDKIAKVREDFSYAMIHDMKTPLSSILACTSLLHSGKTESTPQLRERYFCIIEDETGHLLNLANKVLTISKLESHKLEMAKITFQLKPMVEDLIEKFSAKCAKPLHFTLNLQAEEVHGDEEYLKEAISNLIDNAIKYSYQTVDISISSLNNATHTLIKVRDNGIGISEKDVKHIFEKFERASAFKRSRLGKVAGFGLGLNYVYQVMEAHEGSVTVNSIEKEFSEFTLYIPLKTNDL